MSENGKAGRKKSDDYISWSEKNGKITFKRDERGNIARVEKRLAGELLPIYKAIARFKSENLPKVLNILENEDGTITVEEEYIAGKTLQQLFEEQGNFSEKETLDCMEDIACALNAIHNLTPPIIHRDIKPFNIIKSESGAYVLVDFDAGRSFDKARGEDTKIMLTPGYAAPEQYGFSQTDWRSDIFALGATAYEMLSGKAFKPNGKTLKGGTGRMIAKCTALSPNRRYQSAAALIGAIKRRKFLQKHGLMVMAATAAFAVVVFAVAAALFAPQQETAPQQTNKANTPMFTPSPTQQITAATAETLPPNDENCNCYLDAALAKYSPAYIVLDGGKPKTVEITADLTAAVFGDCCQAKVHTLLPSEFAECFVDRSAQESGVAHIDENAMLTANAPACFNLSAKISYNGSENGMGRAFYVLSPDMAQKYIPQIEQNQVSGCRCQIDPQNVTFSYRVNKTEAGENVIQIIIHAENPYIRTDCNGENHSTLGETLISNMRIKGMEQSLYSPFGTITVGERDVESIFPLEVELITTYNGWMHRISGTVEQADGIFQ